MLGLAVGFWNLYTKYLFYVCWDNYVISVISLLLCCIILLVCLCYSVEYILEFLKALVILSFFSFCIIGMDHCLHLVLHSWYSFLCSVVSFEGAFHNAFYLVNSFPEFLLSFLEEFFPLIFNFYFILQITDHYICFDTFCAVVRSWINFLIASFSCLSLHVTIDFVCLSVYQKSMSGVSQSLVHLIFWDKISHWN